MAQLPQVRQRSATLSREDFQNCHTGNPSDLPWLTSLSEFGPPQSPGAPPRPSSRGGGTMLECSEDCRPRFAPYFPQEKVLDPFQDLRQGQVKAILGPRPRTQGGAKRGRRFWYSSPRDQGLPTPLPINRVSVGAPGARPGRGPPGRQDHRPGTPRKAMEGAAPALTSTRQPPACCCASQRSRSGGNKNCFQECAQRGSQNSPGHPA